jgi:ribonuclease HI
MRPPARRAEDYGCRLVLWTDGAIKNGGNRDGSGVAHGGAAGVLAMPDDEVLEVYSRGFSGPTHDEDESLNVTVNRMEITAVLDGLRKVMGEYELDFADTVVTVHSDSAYVVNSVNRSLTKWMQNGWTTYAGGDVKNRDLWEEMVKILETSDRPRLLFKHVKGHSGIPLQERADELAKGAVLEAVEAYNKGKEE